MAFHRTSTRLTARASRVNVAAVLAVLAIATACTSSAGDPSDATSDAQVADAQVADAQVADARVADAQLADAQVADAQATDADATLPPAEPLRIFFVGNSFTFGGPVPVLVDDLATAAGFPDPTVDYRAVGGQSLRFHRDDTSDENAPDRIRQGWDVVVLQDFSTRPTDSAGDPAGFKADATWFHDLARQVNPDARVVLYETWARRFNHGIYPGTFADPADMQAQLREHYFDAARSYVPANSELTPEIEVAAVGDAWERQLAGGEPPRLHGSDDYHAGAAGQYLNALVIYATIYRTTTAGLPPLGVSPEVAAELQSVTDEITGFTASYPGNGPAEFPIDQTVRVDFGSMAAPGWAGLGLASTTANLATTRDEPTTTTVSAIGFGGVQTGGRSDNDLGWPGEVTADTLWLGSFDGHQASLDISGTITVRGLPAGRYDVTLFASRTGDDGGNGRLTRYQVADAVSDLDVQDNTARLVRFGAVDVESGLDITVSVSPRGASRFAYIGAMELTRLE